MPFSCDSQCSSPLLLGLAPTPASSALTFLAHLLDIPQTNASIVRNLVAAIVRNVPKTHILAISNLLGSIVTPSRKPAATPPVSSASQHSTSSTLSAS
ncbi:hypothetical protein M422DRAFT_271118 [Sphaerobolus stellatus SS14]|uniref:Uncharacterized protein n=1 Tax=Sphaerobolus stellatus (strain SS14) TaxID=990650 RepID=A0A0C9U102_SPHS4|nr:hypothetical protein M422DRAFT_271118 [Sphaerobolus stellatus SS14]